MTSQYQTDDLRIKSITEVQPPQAFHALYPATDSVAKTVYDTRQSIQNILSGRDDRLLVIIGPCSIHDPKAALVYAAKLKEQIDAHKEDLLIVMRVYFEKPRTTVGWKGLINDPDLNDSYQINKGLGIARSLLVEVNKMGVPCSTEFLDLISPQYVSDLISWGAIGARTTESQGHRELASGISCPIGFKNGTDGGFKVAVDAIRAANSPHIFMSLTKQGHSAIFETAGNQDCHVILRGGHDSPNFEAPFVKEATDLLRAANVQPKLMIDCSHANSSKEHKRQIIVAKSVQEQLTKGNNDIMGVMVESHLVEGAQSIQPGKKLTYGQSITDACIHWEDSLDVLNMLASGVQARRQ